MHVEVADVETPGVGIGRQHSDHLGGLILADRAVDDRREQRVQMVSLRRLHA
jgi:hypothetical protein